MTTENNYTYGQLTNGLRTVHIKVRGNVEYCGLCVRVGSRNETPDTYGLAHFVEHTIFKGTKRRHSWHIINRMEAVGGELNAYTSEEATMLYSIFPKGNLARAVELMADLIGNSAFPAHQLEREREVVLDEIASYLDSPSDAIFDSFNDLIFAGSSMGHNILGTAETVSTFSTDVCCRFLDRYYTPDNMVFFYMGPSAPARVETIAEHYLGQIRRPFSRPTMQTPPVLAPFNESRDLGTHQCHTVMGARIPGICTGEAPAFTLLNNIIGGPCMNSLLNVELREHHGYVYSVDSCVSLFSDCGLMTVYFGCDPEHLEPCKRLTIDIFNRLASDTISERRLAAAKKQYLGQLTVGNDNREQRALAAARATLFKGKATPAAETIDRINSISATRLRDAAEHIAGQGLSVLTFA